MRGHGLGERKELGFVCMVVGCVGCSLCEFAVVLADFPPVITRCNMKTAKRRTRLSYQKIHASRAHGKAKTRETNARRLAIQHSAMQLRADARDAHDPPFSAPTVAPSDELTPTHPATHRRSSRKVLTASPAFED